jgi:hypothetical protein
MNNNNSNSSIGIIITASRKYEQTAATTATRGEE